MDDIDKISEFITGDPDVFNEQCGEDMATQLRRFLVRNHGMEEYDIGINALDTDSIADADEEIWKERHSVWYKPFTLSVRRDVLGRGEPKLMLGNITNYLAGQGWVVTDSKLDSGVFEVTVSPKS